MTLPSTGGSWAKVLQGGLNPLAVRYWQTVDGFVRDYLTVNGIPLNLADPACGLGSEGLFTPFAADGITIREDLLFESPGANQGWYHLGELKEDATSISPDQTVQQTPTAQSVRTVRDVLTKLDDKVMFTMIENGDLAYHLRFELPLAGFVPQDGLPNYQIARGETDVLIERQIMLLGTDTDGQLLAEIYPRVDTDKKGKIELARKTPYSQEFTYNVLIDPQTQKTMYVCRAGNAWNAQGNFEFSAFQPAVVPQTGLKANITFPTPTDVLTPAYSVAIQTTVGGGFTPATLGTGGATGTVSGNFTTVGIADLTASESVNAVIVTATGTNATVSSPPSLPFTATSS